jgi:predicted ATP-dependent serine protease
MEKDVVVVCQNCGATKLNWEIVCQNCQDTHSK